MKRVCIVETSYYFVDLSDEEVADLSPDEIKVAAESKFEDYGPDDEGESYIEATLITEV